MLNAVIAVTGSSAMVYTTTKLLTSCDACSKHGALVSNPITMPYHLYNHVGQSLFEDKRFKLVMLFYTCTSMIYYHALETSNSATTAVSAMLFSLQTAFFIYGSTKHHNDLVSNASSNDDRSHESMCGDRIKVTTL